jgi:hypothetical protein
MELNGKEVKQFRDTDYYISEDGVIYRKYGGFYTPNGKSKSGKQLKKFRPENYKICKPHPNHQGYLMYVFNFKHKSIGRKIHQLVAECFIGPCPKGYEVDHIDNNKLNNHYSNLQYLTKQDNINKRWNKSII